MKRCPKCGYDGGWKGFRPTYERGGSGEHLRRTCPHCGYSQTEPTKDADVEDRKLDMLRRAAKNLGLEV